MSREHAPPRLLILLFLFALAACDGAESSPGAGLEQWRGGEQADNAIPEEPVPDWQVFVDPSDEVEPSDPDALHVSVAAQHHDFVREGAKSLLDAGAATPDADPIQALAVAQELMALLAESEVVVVSTTTTGVELVDAGSGSLNREVTFTTEKVIRGKAPESVTVLMRASGSAMASGPQAPESGTQHLVFLEVQGLDVRLLTERGASRIVDGTITGWPGLSPSVDHLVAAIALMDANQGGMP